MVSLPVSCQVHVIQNGGEKAEGWETALPRAVVLLTSLLRDLLFQLLFMLTVLFQGHPLSFTDRQTQRPSKLAKQNHQSG